MNSKIRIKMGAIEVEYEGSEEFLKKELPELLRGVLELHRESGESVNDDRGQGESGDNMGREVEKESFTGTTNTVAAKLSASSGTDLIVAAASRITLVLGKDKISRAELLKEMQDASSYYKKSYSANLTKYLKQLVQADRLREIAKDTYSLSASELRKVKGKL
ncbi:hypothetical protein [Oleiagrimonas soli]|uniref:Uncharacterized protein n=1 Tax=Oleiagrimonas soli TaxID=1543381 RepID=A0A099CYK3_9GAMM|nr:hypothetical protein [Oleiagrimonas soli]KGI78839.1 hypothetical protein LF63_0102585 [Oleiagrimonas soli]MBB6184368.1 hypothetical protein [Oleiagrimonas soli]